MLIRGTDENNLKQRILELEEYVAALEQARLREWTRVNKLEERINSLVASPQNP